MEVENLIQEISDKIIEKLGQNTVSIKMFRVEEAAKLLHLKPGTIYKLCSTGELPSRRLGKTIFVNLSEFL